MVKQVKDKAEDAKTTIKNLRADAIQSLKKMGKSEDVHRFEKQVRVLYIYLLSTQLKIVYSRDDSIAVLCFVFVFI